jgi:hypothetical protein
MFWCLIMANAYFNDLIIPDNLIWKNNNPVIKTLELMIKAALLILPIYAINQEALSDTEGKSNRNAIANGTVKIHIIVTLIFIIALRRN